MGVEWTMPKNDYPELAEWMVEHDYRPEQLAIDLYISVDSARRRLCGQTRWKTLEMERMESITGIAREKLFRKEGY